ncbi:MAG: 2-oxoglutarate ferredoxin oxidoreductase subunit alpha [Cyclobacteriaceae bacterium]|jgi:2-oxoglutarate ferredoxin oxidoreductase subunit alpha
MEEKKEIRSDVTIRFAGDSGDGMQLIGKKFSDVLASNGIDLITFPDFPSEIRAPEGTLYGVSAFQVRLGSKDIQTHGDEIDVLVAMNASSLKVNLENLKKNGIIIANIDGFDARNLKLAEYEQSPLDSDDLNDYHVIAVDMVKEARKALSDFNINPKVLKKSKNFFALGLTFWLINQSLEATLKWIQKKFKNKAEVMDANMKVLELGWQFGKTQTLIKHQIEIGTKKYLPGNYRNVTGNQAVAIGLVAAAKRAELPLFLGSYPITPATEILQYISSYKRYGVKHMQAEDEIAGITSAIGAAYGGSLAVTTTSGPGLSLKTEALGLAVMVELPLLVIDVMRAGPSTGLPTKPEQSDLFQALFGRHGEAPMPVLAASSPSDCFDMTLEAARIALKYMTPVILLTDGYIAQSSEPWRIPKPTELPEMIKEFDVDMENYQPYMRDPVTLARAWVVPGMKGLEHRIGGLEKENITGKVSYDAANHQLMTELRQQKINGIQSDIAKATVTGPLAGPLLIIGWGSTHGAIATALDNLHKQGIEVAHLHLKHLHPLPPNLKEIFDQYDQILIPEMNMGQLQMILKAQFLIPMIGYYKMQGQPFKAIEIENKVKEILIKEEVLS